jgi:ABC-2 type transport system ATP-binding protein
MIEVKNLTRHFGAKVAVDNLSFKVQPGEVLGFLGPNGAGKSTTMKMITGFLRPSSGNVWVCGFEVQENSIAAQRRLGYLPEGAPLYSDMTTAELLSFIAAVRGFSGQEKLRRIANVVERVHLESVLHQSIETLSKGFKRRVGLAQAILHDPEVLILDEPTDGLDPNQKYEVRQLIRTMAKDKVIILSTHILEEVDAVCTRAIIINDGRLLVDDTPTALQPLDEKFRNLTTTDLRKAA